jgi:hypothetical protein
MPPGQTWSNVQTGLAFQVEGSTRGGNGAARATLLSKRRERRHPKALAGRTSLRSRPGFGVDRFARGQDGPFDPDDLVARFPRAGDRQGGSRGAPSAWLWPLKRLIELPMAWPDQWRTLGLQAPTRTRDELVANSNSGNANLRPETLGMPRRQ